MTAPLALVSRAPPDLAAAFLLDEGRFHIGRSSKCEFVVRDFSVSRRHARIDVSAGAVTVTDLDSSNGTFLDDKRIRNAEVTDGNTLRFGETDFVITSCARAAAGELDSTLSTVRGDLGRALGPVIFAQPSLLSPAQCRIFDFLIKGFAEKQIASLARLSQHTVHNHIRSIYRAFAVHSRPELLLRVFGKPTA